MIGFDVIGQAAIGELAGDGNDVLIFVPPAIAAIASKVAPAVAGGGSAIVSGKAVAAALAAPAVRSGVQVAVSSLGATAVCTAGSVQISATVSVSALAASADIVAPRLNAGVLVDVAGIAVSGSAAAPFVASGAQIVVLAKSATAVLAAPGVSIGNKIQVGPLVATIALASPQLLGGNYIEVSNTITMSTPYGEIGSSSIGEFAIGEGEPAARVVKRGLLAIASIQPPFVTAGKSIMPLALHAVASLGRPEIDSRLRKIRVYAIAS